MSEVAQKSLSCVDLVKEYRSRRVVDGVSLQVATGEIVGLTGLNVLGVRLGASPRGSLAPTHSRRR